MHQNRERKVKESNDSGSNLDQLRSLTHVNLRKIITQSFSFLFRKMKVNSNVPSRSNNL